MLIISIAAAVLLFAAAVSVLYPLEFSYEIQSACAEFGVEPSLVRSVIRTESGFDSRAKSRVGAMGLMQLMPRTAEFAARSIGEDPLTVDLFDSGTNIRLGVAYLKYLLGKYELCDALAAYNAGEGNLLRWRAEGLSEYGFAETRAYVKKVLRSLKVYSLLRNP